ncbi:MAG TPA: carbohydrate kinase family protein [Clostridiales bacterium]|nr:carbohydrate kinase family protein [Clostridiales bacterium]
MIDVMGFDNPCMDFLCNLPHMPRPNEGMYMKGQSWQGGGQVATGIVAAARLGATTALCGTVGDDIFGRFCRNDLARHGVDVSGLKMQNGCQTGLSLVLSDEETGGRSILMRQGDAPGLPLEEVKADRIRQAKVLHVAWVDDVVLKAARIAKENGVPVLLDADNYHSRLEEIFPYVDVVIASKFVYDHYFPSGDEEKNLETTLSWGPSVAIYTLGDQGCMGLWEKGFFRQEAFPVQVVDTVGAGDVFHGAYACCMARGMTPVEAARFASAVSAIKCTRIGGRAGIPTWETTKYFLETGEILGKELDERVDFYARGLEYVAEK